MQAPGHAPGGLYVLEYMANAAINNIFISQELRYVPFIPLPESHVASFITPKGIRLALECSILPSIENHRNEKNRQSRIDLGCSLAYASNFVYF